MLSDRRVSVFGSYYYKFDSPVSPGFSSSPMDHPKTALLAAGVLSIVYVLYRKYNRPLIKDIRGPDNPSWIFGALSVTEAALERFH